MKTKDWLEISAMLLIAPLLLVIAGFVQMHYFEGRIKDIAQFSQEIPLMIDDLESRIRANPPYGGQVRLNDKAGTSLTAQMMLSRVRTAQEGVSKSEFYAATGYYLGAAGTITAVGCIVVAIFALLFVRSASSRGMKTRAQLLEAFVSGRKRVPLFMAGHTALLGLALALMLFGVAAGILKSGHMSTGDIKLLLSVGIFAIGSLGLLVLAYKTFRKAMQAFKPEAGELMGRPATKAEAPGLWQLLHILSQSLKTQPPDHVVVGLEGGPFVTNADYTLQPGGTTLTGRTLYLPLPLMSVLSQAEAASILAHELAHFAGDDVRYSSEFVPNFAAIQQATQELAQSQGGSWFNYLTGRGGVMLGSFFLWAMDLCAHHHSRERELVADAAGGNHSGALAAASALLRASSSHTAFTAAMNKALEAPAQQPIDLVAACNAHLLANGWPELATAYERSEGHPFDTHPTNATRLANWGYDSSKPLPADLLQQASRAPDVYPGGAFARFFADPIAISLATSKDLAQAVEKQHQLEQQYLREKASANTEDLPLYENARGAKYAVGFGLLITVFIFIISFLATKNTSQLVIGVVCGTLVGGLFVLVGWLVMTKLKHPVMVLGGDQIHVMDGKSAIAWMDVTNIQILQPNAGVYQTVLTIDSKESPLVTGFVLGRRSRWNRKAQTVTVTHSAPKGLTIQDYAQKIFDYHESGRVRALIKDGTYKLDATT